MERKNLAIFTKLIELQLVKHNKSFYNCGKVKTFDTNKNIYEKLSKL